MANAYLITTDDLFRKIDVSPIQQQIFNELSVIENINIPAANFMALYRNHSSSWIFALLTAFEIECEKDSRNIERGLVMIDFYIRIEEWILEDPSFLASFPDVKRSSIKYKAECMLLQAYARQEALQLINRNKDQQYVSDILHKTELSKGNLYEREKKLSVLFMIMFHHPKLLILQTTELLRFFKFMTEQSTSSSETDTILNIIEKLVKQENAALDPILLTGCITAEVKTKVETIIRFIGAQCLIAKRSNIEPDVLLRLIFYRYLCIMDERHPEALKNLAFNTLVNQNSRSLEYTWEELIDFSLSRFTEKISYFTADLAPDNDLQYTFEGLGLVTLHDKTFTFTPWQNTSTANPIPCFISDLDGAINIKAKYKSKTNLNTCSDLAVLSKHWESALEEYQNRNKRPLYIVKKERPAIGTRLKIRVKNLSPLYPLLAFVGIEDDQYEGDGVLHVSQVTRIKLSTLEGIFCPGDLMTARVIESSDDRLSFSILEDIGTSIGARFHTGEHTVARLQAKKDNLLIWISENGYPAYTPSFVNAPEVGDVHVLQLIEVNYNGYIKARIEEPTEIEIDPQQAVAELISYYIDNTSRYENAQQQEEEEDTEQEDERPLSLEYMRQLIYILDLYTNSNMDYIHKFNMLNTIRLICRIAEESDSEEFYIQRINYMRELYRFTNQKTFDYTVINDGIVQKYPRLYKAQTMLSMLNISNDNSRTEELQTYIKSEQKQVAGLARLLFSRYLLNSAYPQLVEELNTEILSLLAFSIEETKQEKDINFGRENNNREFKSTIVFPPESNCSANIDQQMNNILVAICGFLNAEGGILYIGVNDSGFPQGIETDLKYLQSNEDKYQLLIRRYIVKELGQTINGLIKIDFQMYNEKTVCLITVPSYNQIVSFKDKVWQRQGNSTRLLDNSALKFLKERKKLTKSSNQNLMPIAEKNQLILTSHLNQAEDERVTIAYFSILASGKYIMTKNNPYRNDARITLPIHEDNRDGYLLQIYANACVNRVAVSTILSKKQDYEYTNAQFNNATLIFAAFADKNDYIFIKTALKGEEYIRIQSLKWIKINIDLSRQGTPLFSIPFDRIVQIEVLTSKQAKELEDIKNEISTTLGSPVSSLSVIKEVAYLQNLLDSSGMKEKE